MGYFGLYFGGYTVIEVSPEPEVTPSPVESPLPTYSPEYVDHVEAALNRLCEYAKAKAP